MSLNVAGRLVFRSIHLPGTEQHVVLVAIALVDKRGDALRAVLVQRLPELGTTAAKTRRTSSATGRGLNPRLTRTAARRFHRTIRSVYPGQVTGTTGVVC
jgi:hypothetical protein